MEEERIKMILGNEEGLISILGIYFRELNTMKEGGIGREKIVLVVSLRV